MSEAVEMLIALDKYAGENIAEPPYWLDGDDLEYNNYCYACAKVEVAKHPGAVIDGGQGGENDCCVHCDFCGRPLDYSLTDSGAAAEIAHYQRVRFRKPLRREDAYHIARILGSIGNDSDAVKIARRALKARVTVTEDGV